MFSIIKPSESQIRRFIAVQRRRSFSYAPVGASARTPPTGYTVDDHSICLGSGADVFDRAKAAVQRWEMFNLNWVQLCWPTTPLQVGATVAVLARALGIWSLNACRIVYLIDEADEVKKYGFAYGTLPGHIERGEERFYVAWHHSDDSVWYHILAFSRPQHLLAKIGYPYVRRLQKKFAKDSLHAMVNAVKEPKGTNANEIT